MVMQYHTNNQSPLGIHSTWTLGLSGVLLFTALVFLGAFGRFLVRAGLVGYAPEDLASVKIMSKG